jgi:iron(III) transport system substrate-binding protein
MNAPAIVREARQLCPLVFAALLLGCALPGGTPAPGATEGPVGPASTAAQTGTDGAGWQAEWERTLAAARQEGVLTVSILPGSLFRDWLAQFERKYPGIRLEVSGLTGREVGARILPERGAGQYLWDVYIGGGDTASSILKPDGALDPLKPALILPEVLDDSKWLGGFDAGFTDLEGKYAYAFPIELVPTVYVNRDFVSEAELSRVEQLVEPRWRGRMSIYDPRQPGKGAGDGGHFILMKGEDWWRQLLAQDLVVTVDRRQRIEWAILGRYPVGISISNSSLPDFQQKGVGLNIVPLGFGTELGSRVSLTPAMGLINRAPHPNAAKVFVNWALSREGQQLYAQYLEDNSRRLDVQGRADTMPDPKVQYPPSMSVEAYTGYQHRAMEIAKAVLP